MRKKKIQKQKIKILELFGGIGAPRKALENLGFNVKTIDYVEVWKWPVIAYNRLFNNNYQQQDINKWTISIDICFHGSPCQDWSSAGQQDLAKGRSLLYLKTLAIIADIKIKPKYVIWENVLGLINKNHQSYFQHYLATLEKLGYRNYWKVLNAKDFGIPQSRKRVFVISIRSDLKQSFNFDNLKPKTMQSLLDFIDINENDASYFIKSQSMQKAIANGNIKIINQYVNTITTKQARWNNAGALTVPVNIGKLITNQHWEIKGKQNFGNFLILPRTSDGKIINGAYNRYWKIADTSHMGTITASNPLKIAIPTINNDSSNKMGVSAIPIISSNCNGKIVIPAINPLPNIPIFIINNKPYHLRILTPKETWLLMGFTTNDFDKVQDIPKTHLYHMAGNSIVIPVLEAIFQELLKDFHENAIA